MFFRPDASFSDEAKAYAFIASYYNNLDINHVNIDSARLRGIFKTAQDAFPHDGGISNASPFKRAAFLVCMFAGERPISTPLPPDRFDPQLVDTQNHANAVLALEMAIESLTSPMTGEAHRRWIKVSAQQVLAWRTGTPAETALAHLSEDDRPRRHKTRHSDIQQPQPTENDQ